MRNINDVIRERQEERERKKAERQKTGENLEERRTRKIGGKPRVIRRRFNSPPCEYRGEYVGKAKCRCAGSPEIYRCTRLIRPDVTPVEQALCSNEIPGKPLFDIAGETEIVMRAVQAREIVCCTPSMCDLYLKKE